MTIHFPRKPSDEEIFVDWKFKMFEECGLSKPAFTAWYLKHIQAKDISEKHLERLYLLWNAAYDNTPKRRFIRFIIGILCTLGVIVTCGTFLAIYMWLWG